MATIAYISNGNYYEVSYKGQYYGFDTLYEAKVKCFKLRHRVLGMFNIFTSKKALDRINIKEYCYY